MKILGCTEQTSETTLGKRNKKLNKQYSNQIFQLTISVGENSYFGFAQLGNSLAYNKLAMYLDCMIILGLRWIGNLPANLFRNKTY